MATNLKCEMFLLLYFLYLFIIYQNTLTYAEYILFLSGEKRIYYPLCHSTFFLPTPFLSPCDFLIFLPPKEPALLITYTRRVKIIHSLEQAEFLYYYKS